MSNAKEATFSLEAAAKKIAAARGISLDEAYRLIDQKINPGRTGRLNEGADLEAPGGWTHSDR